MRAAIDGGINFLDNSWDYNHGQSEMRMGKALGDGYRQKVFLMTKTDGRTNPRGDRARRPLGRFQNQRAPRRNRAPPRVAGFSPKDVTPATIFVLVAREP